MKKKIQKPFDIESAKNGAKVETKDGHFVRILCYDRRCIDYPIIALVNFDKNEQVYSYNIDGMLYHCNNDNKNLVIIEEIEYKFDKGDYIIDEIGFVYEITEIDDVYYTKNLAGFRQRWTIEDIESNFHKWTLEDAKPGNVLTIIKDKKSFIFKGCSDKDHPNFPTAFCGIDNLNLFFVSYNDCWWTYDDVRPATVEEKELFFDKLEEAGYKWNSDTLTLSKVGKWRDKEGTKMNGYYINSDATISNYDNGVLCENSYNVFATEKQAKAALAMARISQIMANDERFGGVVTDEEWNTYKQHVILRRGITLIINSTYDYEFLAFHTKEQAKLFLHENVDLIKDYYMLD